MPFTLSKIIWIVSTVRTVGRNTLKCSLSRLGIELLTFFTLVLVSCPLSYHATHLTFANTA